MSRATLKQLYAKDAKRNRRQRSPVGARLAPVNASDESRGGLTLVQRHSDGSETALHIYRCVHCKEFEGQHAKGACLFMPTKFQEMTEVEANAAFPPEPPTITYAATQQVGMSTKTATAFAALKKLPIPKFAAYFDDTSWLD